MDSWQDVVALLVVSLAAASLLRRGWHVFFQRTRGCGGCSTCPSASQSTPQIVSAITALSTQSRRSE